jgi:hypothetical protein
MTMPGFTAERTLRRSRAGRSRTVFAKTAKGVAPAMMISVDGAPYCEGGITNQGPQCYGEVAGGPGGGDFGGGGPNRSPFLYCEDRCREQCGSNSRCYFNCIGKC